MSQKTNKTPVSEHLLDQNILLFPLVLMKSCLPRKATNIGYSFYDHCDLTKLIYDMYQNKKCNKV